MEIKNLKKIRNNKELGFLIMELWGINNELLRRMNLNKLATKDLALSKPENQGDKDILNEAVMHVHLENRDNSSRSTNLSNYLFKSRFPGIENMTDKERMDKWK